VYRAKRRGVRILPGGDYGFAWNPVGRNARDLEHFVTLLGFTPMEAIVSATRRRTSNCCRTPTASSRS
jgi:imidazolonepropionase-like amidohydrolase